MNNEVVNATMCAALEVFEKIDVDALDQAVENELYSKKNTMLDYIHCFMDKVVVEIIGEDFVNRIMDELDNDPEIVQKMFDYIEEHHGVKIEIPQEPPKLELVE